MSAFSSSGFSTNAFSVSAFDFGTAPTNDPVLLGGKAYLSPYSKYKEEEYQREKVENRRAELQRIDDELAEAEQRKLAVQKRAKAKLLAEKAAIKLAALEAKLQDEINVLRIERVRLMRLIDDEEAILVILLSMPFH